jgi:metal-responsive CopG/Arc/MetJ family transcriptional regulator
VKVTFTLDADTVNRLERAAERLSKPKSQVIREAVQEYYQRIGGRRTPAEPYHADFADIPGLRLYQPR